MSVQVAEKNNFTFVAGLNTEAGYFTFPANTWKDGDNVIPQINGSIRKRIAVDLEDAYALSTANFSEANINSYAFTSSEWTAVAGNGNLNFIVAQAGRYVYFYINTSIATSTTKKSFSIDLQSYKVSGVLNAGSAPIKCTSATGKLLITSKETEPLLVEYTEATDTITVSQITIYIRDFEGVDDGLAVDNKPASLSTLHNYNLLNQGWDSTKISAYQTAKSVYPSNAQTWHYGKDSNDDFDASVLDKQDFGTSPAPKGRFVLNLFNQDRDAASGLSGIPDVVETYRPSVCCFYASRAWYAGIQSSRIGTHVLFSQVAIDSGKYGKCHQDADPTSEVLSDLLDNDGGVIPIQDCGTIVDILTAYDGVVILASNGVWQIIGTTQTGFTATGYEVKKLSSFGCVSQRSVVVVEDNIYYWSYNSICMVTKSELGVPVVKSLTDLNIATLYSTIPPLSRTYASGVYNNSDKTIYWLHNDTLISNSTVKPYMKNKVLAFDLRLTAFYTLSFTDNETYPFIVDAVVSRETLDTTTDFNVLAGTDEVIANTDNVVAELSAEFASERQFKFLTVVPETTTYEVTFSDFLTTNDAPNKFYDWYSFNSVGVSYDSFVLTGYNFEPNGGAKKKQALYITCMLERTETGFDVNFDPLNESSCTMQTRWDFTDSADTGKWDAGQEVYRHTRMFIPNGTSFDDGYPVVITKNKVRGRGRALQLKFTADPDYDMRLIGWSAIMMGGTNV